MLSDLRSERTQIDEAILVLERLALGRAKRRGRPPAWLKQPTEPSEGGSNPGKRTFSAETRARMAAAQRRRWAAKRAQANQE